MPTRMSFLHPMDRRSVAQQDKSQASQLYFSPGSYYAVEMAIARHSRIVPTRNEPMSIRSICKATHLYWALLLLSWTAPIQAQDKIAAEKTTGSSAPAGQKVF